MMESQGLKELRDYIISEGKGYSYDVEIPKELFSKHKDELTETKRTWVNANSFRDDRRIKSLHISDYTTSSRDGIIVGHVEHFNPEYLTGALFHLIIDLPAWFIKNRVLEKRYL